MAVLYALEMLCMATGNWQRSLCHRLVHLDYLRCFPSNALSIDQSFVQLAFHQVDPRNEGQGVYYSLLIFTELYAAVTTKLIIK